MDPLPLGLDLGGFYTLLDLLKSNPQLLFSSLLLSAVVFILLYLAYLLVKDLYSSLSIPSITVPLLPGEDAA